ncbi:non-ribosomal peptide synthetase [Pseudomonas oryzihabitans]|uniref:Non-ribosomal peptide synthetase n=1 Tax=Pseudomonas oryzihabitans TaxID=47885 RepID=A0A0U4W5R0_9PSED|nr:non-ribosomal peptide synthetase [Pseudomonas oryzihabitans]ALZ85110.1 non-ribosomal peptide synthetase [Pseudomonas oryzihabitans]
MLHDKALALANRFLALPPTQRRTFLAKLRDQGLDAGALPIPGGAAGECAETSYAQQRLWFLERLQPGNAAYYLPGALRLQGRLDETALREAFASLMARHPSLRTTLEDGPARTPLQRVSEASKVPLETLGEIAAEALPAVARTFANRPFDLERGPLWRLALAQGVDGGAAHLLLCLHHAIADGWSIQVLLDDFAILYRAALEGRQAALPVLDVSYADHARWQRACLEAGEGERQLAFWRERLGTEHPVLELPGDRPRPVAPSHRGGRLAFQLPAPQAHRLGALARAQRTTLFTVLLTAYATLLSRLSGQRDLRIGVPIAGRQRSEVEGVIGCFVNTQVLRLELGAEADFLTLLTQTRERVREAQAHQDLPFEQLVDALAPARTLSHHPLFQVLYNHQPRQLDALQLGPDLRAELLPLDSGSAQFDLALHTWELADGSLGGNWNYSSDLFEPARIEQLHARFLVLLQGLLDAPQQPLAEAPLLLPDEPARLAGWNATAETYAPLPPAGVLGGFLEQVARHPAREALCLDERRLSYLELEQAANRLAHHLRRRGIGRESRVGVAMQRSVEMVIALYGVLKAGAAYVPLDPDYPAERLAFMLEDCGASLLLSHGPALAVLPSDIGLDVLDLERLDLSAEPATAPALEVHPEQLAYLIYTSGSTGRPKGAGNTQAALYNRLQWMQAAYGLDARDHVLQKTPFSFDVSVWEFFWPLQAGARLVLARPGEHRDPVALSALIAREGITTLHFVPSMLAAFLAQDDLSGCASLTRIVCSGEALPAELAQAVRQRLPRVALYNLYGPTEAAIDVTHWTCQESDRLAVPIGRPIANLQIHILDERLNPQPIGVAGELYIGGVGLARGYLGRPGLTAERFVPDPFTPGGRLYRSGDLARWRDDGALDYLGRLDHQVKLRGLRLELGEIEAALRELAGVSEAVVLLRQSAIGPRLVGYLVTPNLDEAVVRQALLARLPDFMVPSHLVALDRLPLTPNGKLDRQALPEPDVIQQAYRAPEPGIETELATLWAELLQVGRIGRDDNFFALGGDSILSLQIIARARRLGLVFSPRHLFERQTLAELAPVVQRLEAPAEIAAEPTEPFALAPIQHAFFARELLRPEHWNQSLLLEPQTRLEPEQLRRALGRLVATHGALRLSFTRSEGRWQQRYRARENADLLWHSSVTRAELPALADEAQASLSLDAGPLLRAVLADLAEGGQRLLLVIHHLAVDGVSWRILLDDLDRLYADPDLGLPPVLPYASWVQALQGLELDSERAYWQQLPQAPALPCDHPAGRAWEADAQHLSLRLDAARTRELLTQAPAAFRTQVNDLLLTALVRALHAWGGEAEARLLLEGHGREDLFPGLDLSRTLGWFTSLYPVRLSDQADLASSLKTVKESLRRIPRGGLGYGLLLARGEQALPETTGSLLFNYLGQLDTELGGFRLADEATGRARDPRTPLEAELALEGAVQGGELHFTCTYSGQRHAPARIQALLDAFATALDDVLTLCRQASGATPADFPRLTLTQAQLDALPLAEIEDLQPLTPMQQGLLFHTELGGVGDLYVNQVSVELDDLPRAAFLDAWQQALRRHAGLRAAFLRLAGEGRAVQAIWRQVELAVREQDWRDQSVAPAALAESQREERERPFDLTKPPLMRLLLIRLTDKRWQLTWTLHHILLDGWSSAALLAEILQATRGAALPAPGRYRDYLDWLSSRDAAHSSVFWQAQLADFASPTRLVDSLGRPATNDDTRSGEQHLVLDRLALDAAARRLRVTLNTLVQAAWTLLLQRYTGQRRIAFGATVAGRPADVAGSDRLLGLFINTLPVVQAPGPELTAAQWLPALQAHNLALREHEHTPLFEVQRLAGHPGQALFDTLLVFENYPVDAALRGATSAAPTIGAVTVSERTHYPLSIAVMAGDRLELQLHYQRACFTPAQVQRMAAHLGQLLDGLVRQPDTPLGDLPLLDAEGLATWQRWNSPAQASAGRPLLPALIAEQARRQPRAIALVHGQLRLDFATLEARSNRLAHWLHGQGVSAETRVGVACERGIELFVALLAVLKAGGAYLPLDPDYPAERLALMLEDSGARLVLTQHELLDRLPQVAGVERVVLDRLDLTDLPDSAPDVVLHPEQLAYVIYTSGSTGRPKGVAVAHGPLALHCQGIAQRYELTAQDRELHFLSISFDGAQERWLTPLSQGARVVIRDQALWSVQETWQALEEQGITVVAFPPSYLRQLADWGRVQGRGPGVKTYCFAGEAYDRGLLREVVEHLQPDWVINGYGPTETVITPTLWRAPAATADFTSAYAPIGDLVGERQGYVLDQDLNLLPVGVEGELYLGGALARGYLERPAETAQRFVPNPFRAGERLYRTGDRVRLNAEGLLEYLGRADQQIKLRGFRIETGEIEAALKACPGVREALVMVRETPAGDRLVGYVGGGALQEMALLELLRQQLPGHLVPQHLVLLERLPQLPNGKLDRRALPAPEVTADNNYEAPATALEQRLAELWQALLQIERVGRQDNFFALGGHSLLATQLISRLRQEEGREVPLRLVFEAPQLAEQAERIAALAPERPEPELQALARDEAPQSYAQQRLWFLAQLEPESAAYHLPGVVELQGALDEQALGAAFTALAARHASLRSLLLPGDPPRQRILPPAPVAVERLVLDTGTNQEAAFTRLLQAFIARPFALASSPPWRLAVVRLEERRHRLLLCLHHAISDGWSVGVLLRDFAELYRAALSGAVPDLPGLPVQYPDYARWQREQLSAGKGERQLAYWRAQLGSEAPTLDLPADRPRPARRSGAGQRLDFRLCAQQAEALRQAARAQGVTPFMLLLSVYGALLGRLSGQRDLRIGVPVAGRTRAEVHDLIGCFVNTQVLRLDLATPVDFAHLVQQVRETLLEAQAHQDLPFEHLVEHLHPERSLSQHPLFQVSYDHQVRDHRALAGLPGLQAVILETPTTQAQFDLALATWEDPDGQLGGSWTFALDLFEPARIEQLHARFLVLLQSLLDAPHQPLAEASLLLPDEPARLAGWNATAETYAPLPPAGVLGGFLEQVARHPAREALCLDERRLSYLELEQAANRLAHHLRRRGIGRESRVGVAMQRSVEMVIALYGVLKAGAAYVPLDPDYPAERLAFMLEDCGASLLLSHGPALAVLPSDIGLDVLDLERLDLSAEPATAPELQVHPEQLAYLIYTSGSTGRPKGAGNTQAALYNRLQWMQAAYGLDARDHVLQKTPFSFDVSVWEFFWPLQAGARLVLARPGEHRDPAALSALIAREGITTLHFVPSMLAAFLAQGDLSGCASLTRIVCSGEALPAELAQAVRQRLPRVALYNLYGPTEAAIDVTHWTCQESDRLAVPIGRPIANLQIHILDERLNPQPIGVAGELYIGGVGLARGYLGRPGLTAERFVPDPFTPGGRLYRSGDLARWRDDGALDYLGRLDHQVKLRGLRLELGEIEAALRELAGVSEAVVLLRQSAIGPRLVGYLVTPNLDEAVVRQALLARLPDFMVPSHLVALDRLPLTPNGKLDRQALPEPDVIQQTYRAPEPGIETELATLWAELLQVERVGRDDDFFALGGHSLLALQVVARLRREHRWEVPVRLLFESATLAAFAERLDDRIQADDAPLQRRDWPGTPARAPQSFAQQRLWFLAQLDPESAAYHLPGGLRLQGRLDEAALRCAFRQLTQRHASLRTTFGHGEAGPEQRILASFAPELDVVTLDRGAADSYRRAFMARPFDLEASPPWRLALVRLAQDEHLLLLCLHHLLADGWSMRLLLEDLVSFYRQALGDESVSPQPLPLDYADYAAWQRERLAAGEGERQLAWWREQLGTEHPLLELPADRPRPAQRNGLGGRETFTLDAATSQRLRSTAQALAVTPAMLLLASWQTLLFRLSGQTDLRIGVPVAGRVRAETEALVGCFVNTLVLRGELAGRMPASALAAQVRARLLDAQSHQELPFEQLVEALQPERHLSHNPLFQLTFNHQARGEQALARLPGLKAEALDGAGDQVHFDLSLGTFDEADGRISGYLDFASDLFERATAQRFLRTWLTLLDGLVRQPDTPLGDLPLLDAEGLATWQRWNSPAQASADRPLLPALIAEQARRQPRAIALVHGQLRLDFATLEARSNRLAHWLHGQGVSAETRVGVACERGIELFVALLAVLKAGGAYLPLDPDYPAERLALMLEDSGARLVLTQHELLERLPQVADVERVVLDRLDLTDLPDSAPDVVLHPEQLAYVIYTSGSTGRPKGVAVAHGPLALHCQGIAQRYELTAQDRELHFLSISFDGAQERWLTPLSQGARVVIRDQALWSVQETWQALEEQGITVVAFPPSYLRQLADWGRVQGRGPGVKTYCFAGEAYDRGLLREVVEHLQPDWVINGYGPTETVITPTLWRAPAATADFTSAYAPIGNLVGERQGYVLDQDLNLLPVGVEGELYLGGALARGYLERPAETAQRFVPNPFRAGERLYRTGDRVRLNAEGLLEYLGRADQQIKLRGFRIETGEIEAALKACPGVREALVMVRETPAGDRLVGYVGGGALQEMALLELLRQQLPGHLVPQHLVLLERLPQLPNGKLDRQALPAPQRVSHLLEEAPQGTREELLAELWRELLGVERIGRLSGFFELGGDSIQSLALISRLQRKGWQLGPKDVFRRPRLAELALCLEPLAAQPRWEPAQGTQRLTPIQAHFFAQPLPNPAHWNQALLLEVREPLESARFTATVATLLQRHDVLRLAFRQTAAGWQAGYRDDIHVEHLLQEVEVADAVALEALCARTQRSFELERGGLLRLVLANYPEGGQRLFICAHHLIMDGVSWRLLLDDLGRIYSALGREASLLDEPRPPTYQAWAERLAHWAIQPQTQAGLAHWQALVPRSDWPVDYPAGEATQGKVHTAEVQLDPERTRWLLREAPTALGARLDEVLLAALAEAVRDWSGRDGHVIALEGHGREALFADLDPGRTLGWFTSLYPLCLACGEDPRATLQGLRAQLATAGPRGLDYGALRYLAKAAALVDQPEPPLAFNYLGQLDGALGNGRFVSARESSGALVDPATPLVRELEINAQVYDGRLGLSCRYSGERYAAATVERLLAAFVRALATLVADTRVPAPGGATQGADPRVHLTPGATGRPPLFCPHPVSGTVVGYYPLAQHLAGAWDAWGLQNRQILDPNWRDTDLAQLARDYVRVLLDTQPSGAYRLLGWSLGGALVLEMASLLERLGKTVAFVGLIDGYVPGAGLARRSVPVAGEGAHEEGGAWAQLLAVEAHLHGLARRHPQLKPLRAPVHAWWASRSPENNHNGHALLERGLGRPLAQSRWIDADHLGIVRDPRLLAEVAERLSSPSAHSARTSGFEEYDHVR